MLDFLGDPLAALPDGAKPEPVLWSSRGTFTYSNTQKVPDGIPGLWRAEFDLAVDVHDPVEMRVFLRTPEQVLSETWLYQYHPLREESASVTE